jgi:hypothetical protein
MGVSVLFCFWRPLVPEAPNEGPQKKPDGPPRTFSKSQTHPPAIRLFFLVRFWAFLGKGSSKTPQTYFCKKSMSKTFPKKIVKNFDGQFFLDFFRFMRCRVFFSDES